MRTIAAMVFIVLLGSGRAANNTTENSTTAAAGANNSTTVVVSTTTAPEPATTATTNKITDSQWSLLMNIAGRQRMLSQKMSKEFFLIASGINVTLNKVNMRKTMALFDSTLNSIRFGNAAAGIPPPPSDLVSIGLEVVQGIWDPFKTLLETNADFVDPTNDDNITIRTNEAKEYGLSLENYTISLMENRMNIFKEVMAGNVPLLKKSNVVVGRYVDAAKESGANVAGLQVDIAGRQRMLTQKMSKEALLINLGISADANLQNLKGTRSLFEDTHIGLLRGVNYVGLPATTKMCTMNQMKLVSSLWSNLLLHLEQVINFGFADRQTMQAIADINPTLLVEMNKAVSLYVSDEGTCNPAPSIPNSEWITLLNLGGKQRMMGQKMSRLFFQIAKGVDTQQSQADFTGTEKMGTDSLRDLIEGVQARGIPAPPTQMIADQLLSVWAGWEEFIGLMTQYIHSIQQPQNAWVVDKIGRMSMDVLDRMNTAVDMYEALSLVHAPEVPSIVINVAGRQRMLLQKMSKEAMLMALGSNWEVNSLEMNDTIDLFQEVHYDLLLGRPATDVAPAINPTRDVCIIQQMFIVDGFFRTLQGRLRGVQNNSDVSPQNLEGIASLQNPAFAAMNKAVGFYAKNKGTCGNAQIAFEEWEASIRATTVLVDVAQRMATEFFLVIADHESGNITTTMEVMDELQAAMNVLKLGSHPHLLPAPPTQQMLDQLFAIEELWLSSRRYFVNITAERMNAQESWTTTTVIAAMNNTNNTNNTTNATEMFATNTTTSTTTTTTTTTTWSLDVVSAYHASYSFYYRMIDFAAAYVDAAWEADWTVAGPRIFYSHRQFVLLRRMMKDAVLIGMNTMMNTNMTTEEMIANVTSDLKDAINLFDVSHWDLLNGMNGTSTRRVQAETSVTTTLVEEVITNSTNPNNTTTVTTTTVTTTTTTTTRAGEGSLPQTGEGDIIRQMERVFSMWSLLKPLLLQIAGSGTADASNVTVILQDTTAVLTEMEEAARLYLTAASRAKLEVLDAWAGNGTDGSAWTPEYVDPDKVEAKIPVATILLIIFPTLAVCIPTIGGIYKGVQMHNQGVRTEQLKGGKKDQGGINFP